MRGDFIRPGGDRSGPLGGEMGLRPSSALRPILFGEVLFDRFPDGAEVLGGAPFNVAWHLRGFGENPLLVSRVGADEAGRRVRQAMAAWGLDTSALQTDPDHPTGTVRVDVEGGEPRFHILPDQAYDFIRQDELPEPGGAACVYHGSLALRRPESAAAWQALARRVGAPVPVFLDVNLRPPWWRREDVQDWIGRARWVKLNREELDQLAPAGEDAMGRAEAFLALYRLEGLFVTLGEAGALALTARGERKRALPDTSLPVVDTVGAGDAFAAVCLLGRARGWSLALTLDRALSFAGAVVGVRGAVVADRAFYRPFLDAWENGGN